MEVHGANCHAYPFTLGARHKQIITQGLDLVGATLRQILEIVAFEESPFSRNPWMQVLQSAPVSAAD